MHKIFNNLFRTKTRILRNVTRHFSRTIRNISFAKIRYARIASRKCIFRTLREEKETEKRAGGHLKITNPSFPSSLSAPLLNIRPSLSTESPQTRRRLRSRGSQESSSDNDFEAAVRPR